MPRDAEAADTAPDLPPLIARADLAEAACMHFAFVIGCLVAGWVAIAVLQPPEVGWNDDGGEPVPRLVVDRGAFEDWAGRLLLARSGVTI